MQKLCPKPKEIKGSKSKILGNSVIVYVVSTSRPIDLIV